MSLRRLFPDRWARILTWTAAAVAWGTAAVAVSAAVPVSQPPDPPATGSSQPAAPRAEATSAPLPETPPGGLVIIRYTPAGAPPAQVITQTVSVAGAVASAPASSQAPATVASSGS